MFSLDLFGEREMLEVGSPTLNHPSPTTRELAENGIFFFMNSISIHLLLLSLFSFVGVALY